MELKDKIHYTLDRMSQLVDRKHFADAEALQQAIINYESVPRIPVVLHGSWVEPVDIGFEQYPLTEAWQDVNKMFYNELLQPMTGISIKDDRILSMRVDFGPATMTSAMGLDYEKDDNTSWARALHSTEKVKEFIAKGVPDFSCGQYAKIEEFQGVYQKYLDAHGLSDVLHIFQASNQGPFDLAQMIWGEEIYTAMYDEPETVHELTELCTLASIDFVKRQKRMLKETDKDYFYHWQYKVKGGGRVINDLQNNISPQMYKEFVAPYVERFFAELGGGYEHYCGFYHQNLEVRMAVSGVNGSELVEDRFDNRETKLLDLWEVLARRKQTVYWVASTLDDRARAKIRTGLVFGYVYDSEKENGAGMLGVLDKVRKYWTF